MIRFFDITFSALALICLSPFLIIIAILITIDSKGGVFYQQERVGINQRLFYLFKFRSMYLNSDKKGLLTVGTDSRITKMGAFLRKYKIDELPQLINVLKGEMSLVGPRPEVLKYVKLLNQEQKRILNVKPGVSGYASLEYFDENAILATQQNPEQYYIDVILPEKVRLEYKYVDNPTLHNYFTVIIKTVLKIVKS